MEARGGSEWSRGGSLDHLSHYFDDEQVSDPDTYPHPQPHQSGQSDPDHPQSKKSDPHQRDADLQD